MSTYVIQKESLSIDRTPRYFVRCIDNSNGFGFTANEPDAICFQSAEEAAMALYRRNKVFGIKYPEAFLILERKMQGYMYEEVR